MKDASMSLGIYFEIKGCRVIRRRRNHRIRGHDRGDLDRRTAEC